MDRNKNQLRNSEVLLPNVVRKRFYLCREWEEEEEDNHRIPGVELCTWALPIGK